MNNKKKRPSYKVTADFNNGNYDIIPAHIVAAFGKRLKRAMEPVDREFRRTQRIAHEQAAKTIINA